MRYVNTKVGGIFGCCLSSNGGLVGGAVAMCSLMLAACAVGGERVEGMPKGRSASQSPGTELFEPAFEQDPAKVIAWQDDLNAAVSWALARGDVQMAVLEKTQPSPNIIMYRLTTADDRPAWLRFTDTEGGQLGGTHVAPVEAEIAVHARVGRFGSSQREAALIRRVAERLAFLRERSR